ncbi:MAG: hypothetical protein KDK40_02395, partial [Chlamydiia bacterium]|nr:hypothetical protein [Chlamydiia bacterium]
MNASVPLDSTESVLSNLSTVFFEKLIVYSLPEHRERLSKTDALFAEMIQKVRDLAVKVEIIAEADSTGDWF